jgi:hypothetical protein
VPREPKAFVVQPSKLLQLSAGQLGPLAKEVCETLVASRALDDEVGIVESGKIGREFSHRSVW